MSLLDGATYSDLNVNASTLNINKAANSFKTTFTGNYTSSFGTDTITVKKALPDLKNLGFAISGGASYTSRNGLYLTLNIKDLGFIHWNKTTPTYSFDDATTITNANSADAGNRFGVAFGSIINNNATLTIKAKEDLHYNYHEEMRIKTDSTAVVVGAVVAVAAVAAAGVTAGGSLALAAASGAATGAQGKKGKTTVTETTEITQIKSNLNFTNDLNTQSSGNTVIKASNLTADNATILTGKFRDQSTGVENVVNVDSKLKLESAFDSVKTHTTVEKVKPNYVGIAVVSGVKTYISGELFGYDPSLPEIALTGYSLKTDKNPEEKGMFDLVVNFRDKSSSSTYKRNEVKTNLNFSNLITQ